MGKQQLDLACGDYDRVHAGAVRYSYEQGIIRRQISVDELFAAPTLERRPAPSAAQRG